MKILNRYIIKEHFGPFVFGLSVIMFILLMNFLVKYIGKIFGKGLELATIFKLIYLNLSWMLALAVPMATLIAVLMAYGRFSADNEITILKSSGISIYRIIRPSLFLGILITAVMIYFNDQILPESNHQAKVLFRAINQKKPTLQLEEHILYKIGKYTFSVSQIEKPLPDEWLDMTSLLGPEYRSATNIDRLNDLVIFDRSDPREDITITARHGWMVFSEERKSILFTLFDGEYHKWDHQKPDQYQRSFFDKQLVVIPAKDFVFEEQEISHRSDREMNIKMMQDKVHGFERQIQSRLDRIGSLTGKNMVLYKRQLQKAEEARESAGNDSVSLSSIPPKKWLAALRKARNNSTRLFQQMRMHQSFIDSQERNINRFLVEIYKKVSIPFACIVFVLVGAPLGVMARKGNMGMAISMSIGFFMLYWIFLIGGEELADRKFLPPFAAMWAANFIVGTAGLYLTWRAVKESSFINWDKLARFFKPGKKGQNANV